MSLPQKRLIALLGLGMLGTLAVLPYQLLGPLPEAARALPLSVVILSAIVNALILVTIAVSVGGVLAPRVGLSTPVLDAALTGQPFGDRVRGFAGIAVVLGVLATVAIVLIDALVFVPALRELAPDAFAPSAQPPLWSGALASLYGAFTEEILLRYFLMSLVAWLVLRLAGRALALPIAIVITAVLFGLGHLPATAAIFPLTPLVVARAVLLNGLAGLAFGWLYWRHGLEAAMLSHFAADIGLHLITPALASLAS